MIDVNRNNLYVGRPFFIEPERNAIHYWRKARHGIVTSIGRKYFYVGVEGSRDVLRFEVEGGAYAYEKKRTASSLPPVRDEQKCVCAKRNVWTGELRSSG